MRTRSLALEFEAFARGNWITADQVGGLVAELLNTGMSRWPAGRADGR